MSYSASPASNMNDSDDGPRGRVSVRDLDARQAEREADHAAVAQRIAHLHRATLLPAGLDQQGRHATRAHGPIPAEAATELGAEPEDQGPARGTHRRLGLLLVLLSSILSVGVISALAGWGP